MLLSCIYVFHTYDVCMCVCAVNIYVFKCMNIGCYRSQGRMNDNLDKRDKRSDSLNWYTQHLLFLFDSSDTIIIYYLHLYSVNLGRERNIHINNFNICINITNTFKQKVKEKENYRKQQFDECVDLNLWESLIGT